ncbi:DNA mismatch endonuclease Vsr [Flavobacterium sp. DG1-102-2]|uniref:very short patch repair endonuclease n=1 Tax=Flavobacterium sp. DG1-102-2 TaxID=3081663 RepID=UPI00294955FE|nr:DNA mismatch endonuclease Vsr [Flavobacterium sp. DG1-102-2]MDV6169366.1 DNA mismatch endonuclease Vsr [Flavobacterium sp. DG1-102-2]
MDRWSKEKRSEVMSKIRSKDTKPEKKLRSLLFSRGLRYRIHYKKLPGTPDIVFPKYKTVIFVHGCFWHHHEDCNVGRVPKSNRDFWYTKLSRNIERDKKNQNDILKLGWKVIVVWECELKKPNDEFIDLLILKIHCE